MNDIKQKTLLDLYETKKTEIYDLITNDKNKELFTSTTILLNKPLIHYKTTCYKQLICSLDTNTVEKYIKSCFTNFVKSN